MATNKTDPMGEFTKKFPAAAPWIFVGINVLAATINLMDHYRNEIDNAFMAPYTHIHYIDPHGNYICGDQYINRQHKCNGRFLNVEAKIPSIDDFIKLGLTKEQWEVAQKMIKQFKCEGPHE